MTPYEEEKKKRPGIEKPKAYNYQSDQGTYYGEPGNDHATTVQTMINEWAAKNDPAAQAEQDARIQRGRQFWTGANLFANVVANAINANGTAKGAPNMTWNDNASQKMYESWQAADKELKADRRAAQQRLDALRLQDAQMRAAGSEKRAAEAKHAYDVNYGNEAAYIKAKNDLAQKDYEMGEKERAENERIDKQHQFSAAEAQKQRGFQASENEKNRTHQDERDDKRLQRSKGYNKGNKTIRIGNTDFKAETEAEADSNIAQVYGMVLRAYNGTQDALHQQTFDGKPETEYSFINAHFNQLYTNDPTFKAQYDEWARQHQRSVNTNNNRGGSTMPGVGNSNSTTMPGV